MAKKHTSVVLSRGESTDKDNYNGKRKANKRKNKKSLNGAGTYKTKYYSSWDSDYPVKTVKDDIYKCVPCIKTLSCEHQGLADVKLHCSRDSHKLNLK